MRHFRGAEAKRTSLEKSYAKNGAISNPRHQRAGTCISCKSPQATMYCEFNANRQADTALAGKRMPRRQNRRASPRHQPTSITWTPYKEMRSLHVWSNTEFLCRKPFEVQLSTLSPKEESSRTPPRSRGIPQIAPREPRALRELSLAPDRHIANGGTDRSTRNHKWELRTTRPLSIRHASP